MYSKLGIHIAKAGAAAALLLLGANLALAESSSVTGHEPLPDGSRPEPPSSGPGRSRLPLVDPRVVPPGVSDPSQKPPAGKPGAAAPGTPGQSAPPPAPHR